jgi:hypothetical protein
VQVEAMHEEQGKKEGETARREKEGDEEHGDEDGGCHISCIDSDCRALFGAMKSVVAYWLE